MNATTTTIVKNLLELFTKVNSDCMRDGQDSIPYSDIDYYAEQIEVLLEVPEIRAYELATLLAKVTGANHSCYFCDQDDITSDLIHDPKLDLYICDSDYCCQEATRMRCEICDEKIDCGEYTEATDTGCVHAYCNDIEKEKSMFKTEGFNHVPEVGIAQLWQYFQMKGAIDLLYDMKPMDKINEIMQSENFDMDAHIKTNYCDNDGQVPDYDDIVMEFIDELMETIIILEYCYMFDVYSIDFKGKSIHHLDSIPECDEWNPNVYLPITGDRLFTSQQDLEKFVMDYFTPETSDYDMIITITAHPAEDSDYDCDQVIPFRITGACEYNLMLDLCRILEGEGYVLVFTCNK